MSNNALRTRKTNRAEKAQKPKVEWFTHPDLLALCLRAAGETRFGFDPAGHVQDKVNAKVRILPPANGLDVSWRGHGLDWCNPPYGKKGNDRPGLWVNKMVIEFGGTLRTGDRDHIYMLLPASTAALWYHDLVTWGSRRYGLTRFIFLKGRQMFLSTTGAPFAAPFSSLLIYHGHATLSVTSTFRDEGHHVVTP